MILTFTIKRSSQMVGQEMHPKENEKSDGNNVEDEDMEEEEEYEDMTAEEFNSINNQIDAINSALDNIEQKNDDIRAQLLELLEANRAVRKQMQEQSPKEQKNGGNV